MGIGKWETLGTVFGAVDNVPFYQIKAGEGQGGLGNRKMGNSRDSGEGQSDLEIGKWDSGGVREMGKWEL